MDTNPIKLTSKYQATIPKAVRDALDLKQGDRIVYEILDDKKVIIRKVYPIDLEYLYGVNQTCMEWELKEDEKAYRDL